MGFHLKCSQFLIRGTFHFKLHYLCEQLVSNGTNSQPQAHEVPRRQSMVSENGGQGEFRLSPDDPMAHPLSRCNIQVNLRHVNTNSHQFSLNSNNSSNNNHGEQDQFQGTKSTVPSTNHNNFSTPLEIHLSRGHDRLKNNDSSSDEDDDSVWYEYGCV